MYALVALGYTMVYGIIGLINFAHGDLMMVAALVGWTCIAWFTATWPDAPGWLVLCCATSVACLGCAALNIGIERLAYRPLRNSPRLAPLVTAVGVSMLLQTLAMIIWRPEYKSFPSLLPTEPLGLSLGAGHAVVSPTQLLTIAVTALSLAALAWLVHGTRLGRAMRATAENPRVAMLMGIPTDRVIALTFALGAVLAAIAGVLWASNYGVAHHSMGLLPGLKAFTAAVLGGIGNLPGAVVGGLVLGLLESMGAGYLGTWTGGWMGSHYADVLAFLVLITVLTLRPQGLLGERVAERA